MKIKFSQIRNNKFLKWYLHWKWQRRYDMAWNISCHKAYDGYNEDIAACHPLFYFHNELMGLK